MALAEIKSKDSWEEHKIDKLSIMAISEEFEVENSASLLEDDLNGNIVKLKTKMEDKLAIADFGSSMSLLNEKTALRLQENDMSTKIKFFPSEDAARIVIMVNT